MPKFMIERDIPGAGQWSADELKAISQRSCSVLTTLGPAIQWVESFVTDDRVYCLYIAPNEELIREHAAAGRLSGDGDTPDPVADRSRHGGLKTGGPLPNKYKHTRREKCAKTQPPTVPHAG